MPRTTRLAAALLLTVALALTGCGKDSSSPKEDAAKSSTPSATPTPTPTPSPVVPKGAKVVKGNGYTFAMPSGWHDLTGAVKKEQASVDVAVGNKVQTDGFTNNLNVVLTPSGGADADDLDTIAKEIQTSLKPSAPDYAIQDHTTIAGLPAVHLSGVRAEGKQKYWLEQFVIIGPEQSQVISFSFAASTKAAQRDQLITTVLKSWSINN